MHQITFSGRARPGPAGGAYSAPQSWIKESLLLREGEWKEWRGGREENGKGRVEGPLLLWTLDTPLSLSSFVLVETICSNISLDRCLRFAPTTKELRLVDELKENA